MLKKYIKLLKNKGLIKGNKIIVKKFIVFLNMYKNTIKNKNSPNICFIWVPKTGGTSIYTWLKEEIGMLKLKTVEDIVKHFPQKGAFTFGHISYKDLIRKKIIGEEYDRKSYKFTFVRNPYDRALSLYYYFQKHNRIEKSMTFYNFLNFIDKNMDHIGLYNLKGLSQCNPQVEWLIDNKRELIVDYVAKFEDFNPAGTPHL
jgi:hypothetical protein